MDNTVCWFVYQFCLLQCISWFCVQLFDEKLLNGDSATKKPMSDKRKKEQFKLLVQDAIGVSS